MIGCSSKSAQVTSSLPASGEERAQTTLTKSLVQRKLRHRLGVVGEGADAELDLLRQHAVDQQAIALVEQHRAHMRVALLELADQAADGRLRQVQRLGRVGEVAQAVGSANARNWRIVTDCSALLMAAFSLALGDAE